MITFVMIMDIAGSIIGYAGPYNWTLRECDAHVELWVKMYAIEPRINGQDRRAVKYQCVSKLKGHRA